MLNRGTRRNGCRDQDRCGKLRLRVVSRAFCRISPPLRLDEWLRNGADLLLMILVAWSVLSVGISGAADPPPASDVGTRLPVPTRVKTTEQGTDEKGETAVPQYDTLRPIGTLTTNIVPKCKDEAGNTLPVPENLARVEMDKLQVQHHQSGYSRPWSLSTYDWEPTALYHGPLYFEETFLERFGQEVPLFQPVVSAAQFYTGLPELPYKIGAQVPWKHIYALGYDRPGNCVPFQWELPPPSVSGVLFADVVITGLVFAIP